MGRILAVNRPTAPFRIIDGRDEGVDLIAQWYEIFAKAGLRKVFQIQLKFDADAHEVRTKDHDYSLSWSMGVPTLELSASRFSGHKQSVQFGAVYAFAEEFRPAQVYEYRFSTGKMKRPIHDAVMECGWTYKRVALGKLWISRRHDSYRKNDGSKRPTPD